MSATIERPREFHCPNWPGCFCPDGTVASDCPGRVIGAERAYHVPGGGKMIDLAAAIVEARTAEREGRALRAVSALEALQDADSHKAAIRNPPGKGAPAASSRQWSGKDWAEDWGEPEHVGSAAHAKAQEAMAREQAAATATSMDIKERVAGDYRAFTREKAERQALSRLVAENDERQRLLTRAEASRRGRTISGETLIADMNALLIRCERGLAELNAIHTELTMIRNNMAQLHGLPKT